MISKLLIYILLTLITENNITIKQYIKENTIPNKWIWVELTLYKSQFKLDSLELVNTNSGERQKSLKNKKKKKNHQQNEF